MRTIPWDQRAARVLVRPLARTAVSANQITALSLLVCLAGAALFAAGGTSAANWGAGLFIFGRFLDHLDGELARLKGTVSRFGYYFDYATGGISHAALFLGVGVGLSGGGLGGWAGLLGLAGAAAALAALFLNIGIDSEGGAAAGRDAVGYPAFAGFELEDGIYLLGPVTWLGFLEPFFVAAGLGAALYCLWSLGALRRLRRRRDAVT